MKHLRKMCQEAIALTMKETKERAKKDMVKTLHDGRVMDGQRKRATTLLGYSYYLHEQNSHTIQYQNVSGTS